MRLPAVGKIDEIHNLNIATRAGVEASDTLKYFSERIPAMFVLAGISVERAGLLSGTRGEQIAGRLSMVRAGPFPLDGQWAALVAALEGSLRLHQHQRGSLLWLIRSAAIQAVIALVFNIDHTNAMAYANAARNLLSGPVPEDES